MQQQVYQEQQGDPNYEFAAYPQAVQPKGKYRESYNPEEEQQEQEFDPYQDQDGEKINYYEELTDPIEDEQNLIPDYYVDRPPTPEYKPKEAGVDVGTQVIDQELFDFIIEVKPVLQVLVGKTLDLAKMELIEEWEEAQLKKHKEQYQKQRNAELMVTCRMEKAFIRRKEEKQRRDLQHFLRREQNNLLAKKLLARKIAQRTLRLNKKTCLNDLESQGFLRDEMQFKVKYHVQDYLFQQTFQILQEKRLRTLDLQKLLSQFEQNASQRHLTYIQRENKRRQDILDERERLRREKEERIRKKQEWKRKMNLNQERSSFLQQIEDQIIQKSERLDQVLDSEVNDVFTSQGAQGSFIFGGLLAQIQIVLDSIAQISGKPITKQLLRALLLHLIEKTKTPIKLYLTQTQRDHLEAAKKRMQESNEFDFQSTIDEILLEIQLPSTLEFLQNKLNLDTLKGIYASLLELQLQSYLKTLPPNEQNEALQAEIHFDVQNLLKKVILVGISDPTAQLDALVNIRVPFEPEPQPEGAEEAQEEVKEEPPKTKEQIYDEFVETYEGIGYEKLKQSHQEKGLKQIDIDQEHPNSFNFAVVKNKSFCVFDERDLYFIRKELFHLLQETDSAFIGAANFQQIRQIVAEFDEIVEKEFLALLAQQKIPIFDIEFHV